MLPKKSYFIYIVKFKYIKKYVNEVIYVRYDYKGEKIFPEATQHQAVIRSNARVQIVKILAIPQCTTSLWHSKTIT